MLEMIQSFLDRIKSNSSENDFEAPDRLSLYTHDYDPIGREEYLIEALRNQKPDDLTSVFLLEFGQRNAYPLMSPEAFVYYLPAFLKAALLNSHECFSDALEYYLNAIRRGVLPETRDLLSDSQWKLICDLLDSGLLTRFDE